MHLEEVDETQLLVLVSTSFEAQLIVDFAAVVTFAERNAILHFAKFIYECRHGFSEESFDAMVKRVIIVSPKAK